MKVTTPVVLIAAMALLAGCVSSGGPRDAGGKRMQLSEWQEIPKTDIVFNLADLGDISVATLQTRTRNNAIAQQRARFGGQRTYFFVEHLPASHWVYNYATTEKCLSEEVFKDRLRKPFSKDLKTISFERIDRIRKSRKHSGFIGVAKLAGSGERCTVGHLCFLSAGKNHTQTDERFDSIISFRDCKAKWTFDEMKTWLQGVKILPKS